ncbi:hypothetical protein ACIBI0_34680 [Microbispora rosea]|uniref:hypothetical protein n=1 Tax=Microbispora rosea TaxID=58117 RepID=UPI003798C3EF
MSRMTRLAAMLFALGFATLQPYFGQQAGTVPAGTGYDTANRCYAVVLGVLVWLCVLLRRHISGAAATLSVGAAATATAGVALEFWIGPLQDRPLSADAQRAGLPNSAIWWGSNAGFWAFAAAAIVLAVTTIVWGAQAGRRGTLPRSVTLALGLTGPLVVVNFGLTNFGPVVAGAGGVLLAGSWLFAALRVGERRGAAQDEQLTQHL